MNKLSMIVLVLLSIFSSFTGCEEQKSSEKVVYGYPEEKPKVFLSMIKEAELKAWSEMRFPQPLLEIFRIYYPKNVHGYTVVEGSSGSMTGGGYLVGDLPDGTKLWLVSAMRSYDNQPNFGRTINALVHCSKSCWEEHMRSAKEDNVAYPSVSYGLSPDRIEYYGQPPGQAANLEYVGTFFKHE